MMCLLATVEHTVFECRFHCPMIRTIYFLQNRGSNRKVEHFGLTPEAFIVQIFKWPAFNPAKSCRHHTNMPLLVVQQDILHTNKSKESFTIE